MVIKTLVENTSVCENINHEHGLSLYIETKKHKILFDLGASTLLFENAKKMEVDISAVDLVVISHGHYDHGGGLKAFLDANPKAKIYLHQKAFNEYYADRPGRGKVYIGLDKELLPNDRFIFTKEYLRIDDELELFSGVKSRRLNPTGNKDLFMKNDACMVNDDFTHEQNLIIKEDRETVLFAGCAHNGIVNIIEHFNNIKNSLPSHVIGGFHLYNRAENKYEDFSLVSQIGEFLKKTGLMYYTGHCTGIEPYNKMKEIMGDRIQYIAAGSTLIL